MKSTVSGVSVRWRIKKTTCAGSAQYSRPTLVVYGSVREFTKGGSGTNEWYGINPCT